MWVCIRKRYKNFAKTSILKDTRGLPNQNPLSFRKNDRFNIPTCPISAADTYFNHVCIYYSKSDESVALIGKRCAVLPFIIKDLTLSKNHIFRQQRKLFCRRSLFWGFLSAKKERFLVGRAFAKPTRRLGCDQSIFRILEGSIPVIF